MAALTPVNILPPKTFFLQEISLLNMSKTYWGVYSEKTIRGDSWQHINQSGTFG